MVEGTLVKGDCMIIVGSKNNQTIYFGSLACEEVDVVLLCSTFIGFWNARPYLKPAKRCLPKTNSSYTTVPDRVPNEDKPGGDPANAILSDNYGAR